GHWRPVSVLRGHLSRHPPVVVFFLCLLILSITFVCIGLYSQYHDIKNPDISLGWNQVLGSIAGFQFCTHLNDTDAHLEEDSPRMVEHAHRITTNVSMSTSHVSVLVPLVLMGNVPADSVVSATMLGSQLGVKGAPAKTSVNVSFHLHPDVPNNQTLGGTHTGPSLICLQLTALTHVLPQTPSPPECSLTKNVDETTSLVRAVAIETYEHDSPHCFSLGFTADPHLTVLLTQEEKAICRYHLLLVSVSLLVICVLMTLCGTCSSKSHSYQANDLQKTADILCSSSLVCFSLTFSSY
ncbi:insulin-like growth factor-binding protein 3 receptor, partial [Triplophysa rosa]